MRKNSAIIGATFLMATSAIGPGFLTQTSLFTEKLLSSFGFVILISCLLDIGAQLNIWRVITMSKMYAQDLSNRILPGAGYLLAFLIAFGGMVFNIGNIAGTGLGLSMLTGWPMQVCATLSAAIAIAIFLSKDAGKAMDAFVKVLGIAMVLLTVYVAVASGPPIGEAVFRTFVPQKIDFFTIVTIVGGTVGGYISFAGAHRLLEAGVSGREMLPQVSQSAVRGILITSIMRFILFLAALGIVAKGIALAKDNPAAAVFEAAAGKLGYIFFGVVLWAASITSVVGASYTSVSFCKTLFPFVRQYEKLVVSLFIVIACVIFYLNPKPVQLLVIAGAVNGLILPIALMLILIACRKKSLMNGYSHPQILWIAGWIIVVAMGWMGVEAVLG